MPEISFKMITGLGNPGRKYAQTRHNIGFLTIDALAAQQQVALNKSGFDAHFVKTSIQRQPMFLVKPLSFMNRSGFPVHRLAAYYKISMKDIIVIHDDMDLMFGQIKIVQNRGHGGHNGIRSIFNEFGKKECIRVRIGVGHPGHVNEEVSFSDNPKFRPDRGVTGHVLGKFSPAELKRLDEIIKTACDACNHIITDGVVSAMNIYNQK